MSMIPTIPVTGPFPATCFTPGGALPYTQRFRELINRLRGSEYVTGESLDARATAVRAALMPMLFTHYYPGRPAAVRDTAMDAVHDAFLELSWIRQTSSETQTVRCVEQAVSDLRDALVALEQPGSSRARKCDHPGEG